MGEISTIVFSNGIAKSGISYKYKGRLVFFIFEKNEKGACLHSIEYYRKSFQRIIHFDDSLYKNEINKETMSSLSIPPRWREILTRAINS